MNIGRKGIREREGRNIEEEGRRRRGRV